MKRQCDYSGTHVRILAQGGLVTRLLSLFLQKTHGTRGLVPKRNILTSSKSKQKGEAERQVQENRAKK